MLPPRVRRRFEGEERLEAIPAAERADERVLAAERAAAAREVRSALHAALASLTEEDRRILGMRYREGVTVRQIAATLHLEARLLYRRIERCLRQLRARMAAQGVSPETIRTLLGRGEARERQEASPARKTAPF